MKPTEWGWKQENNKLIPIMTHCYPAPGELLTIIHCNCVVGRKSFHAASDSMDSSSLLYVLSSNLCLLLKNEQNVKVGTGASEK